MSERLPARLEATALIRVVESKGGFATVIKRGDADSGAIILVVTQRGQPKALIERRMAGNFTYVWTIVNRPQAGEPEKFHESTANHARSDPDCWLIELDIPDAERFIAETISAP